MIAPMCVSVRLSVLLADRHRCARCPCAAVLPRCRVSVALLSVCLISLPQWYTSSEHLPPGELLTGRRLDLAVLFQNDSSQGRSAIPVLDERLFLLARRGMVALPDGEPITMAQLGSLPQAVTSKAHGLRAWVEAAFERAGVEPWIGVEVDGLTTLMDLVQANALATIQPGAAVARVESGLLSMHPIDDPFLFRRNLVYCINDEELSPAALAARVVLLDVMRALVRNGGWPGATLLDS